MYSELSTAARLIPTAAAARIHHLHPWPDHTPDDFEVTETGGQPGDHQRRQAVSCRRQHVLGGHHLLICVKTESIGEILQVVDGAAINTGVTGFAQTAIAGLDAES